MLTKRCYDMLKKMNQTEPDEGTYGYSVHQLASICGMQVQDALGVAELLENHGYLVGREISIPSHRPFKESFKLTELGRAYKEIRWQERLSYIRDKWTDIIACVISVIALIVSICTAISN